MTSITVFSPQKTILKFKNKLELKNKKELQTLLAKCYIDKNNLVCDCKNVPMNIRKYENGKYFLASNPNHKNEHNSCCIYNDEIQKINDLFYDDKVGLYKINLFKNKVFSTDEINNFKKHITYGVGNESDKLLAKNKIYRKYKNFQDLCEDSIKITIRGLEKHPPSNKFQKNLYGIISNTQLNNGKSLEDFCKNNKVNLYVSICYDSDDKNKFNESLQIGNYCNLLKYTKPPLLCIYLKEISSTNVANIFIKELNFESESSQEYLKIKEKINMIKIHNEQNEKEIEELKNRFINKKQHLLEEIEKLMHQSQGFVPKLKSIFKKDNMVDILKEELINIKKLYQLSMNEKQSIKEINESSLEKLRDELERSKEYIKFSNITLE